MNKMIKYIKNPSNIIIYLMNKNFFNWMSDEQYLKIKYRLIMKKKLDLEKPQTYNEKLQWLKLNDRKNGYTKMVDKYEAKKYVASVIGEQYIIPTLGVWEKFKDINFEILPKQFVLKPTHTSGDVFICKDKNNIDYKKLKKKVNKWLKRKYYFLHREWPYKNVKPRIIAETYIENKEEIGLKDYKFMCFNGKVKCSFVCTNRNSKQGLSVDFFDLNWKKMPFTRHYPNSGEHINKPINYNQMLQLAEKLAKNIPFVRVDFYEVNRKIYFGELTFYPGAGFEEFSPEKYDRVLGEWLDLPEICNN
ncbi:glycosyltransferase [Clostridium sp. CAG:245]|jgi:hypothetical protein|nr:glycosyltransferase [Clostridium sp. CAG:245]